MGVVTQVMSMCVAYLEEGYQGVGEERRGF